MTRNEAIRYTLPIPAYDWTKYGLTVVRDGFNPETGKRIHVVKEEGFDGQTIANALVFTE